MVAPTIVLLLGSSLLMAGLQTSLKTAEHVQVVCMEALGPSSEGPNNDWWGDTEKLALGSLKLASTQGPDVKARTASQLFKGAKDASHLARLVKDNPNLVLLGMDAASSDLIVLSSERHTINNLTDIVHVIEARSQH